MRRRLIALALLLAGCTLAAADPTPNTPTVDIQFVIPANGSAIADGAELDIQLLAQDPEGVARVQLLVNDQPHLDATPVDAPAVPVFLVDMNWLASGVRRHGLTAVSFREDGSISATESIVIEVTAAETTPEATPEA